MDENYVVVPRWVYNQLVQALNEANPAIEVINKTNMDETMNTVLEDDARYYMWKRLAYDTGLNLDGSDCTTRKRARQNYARSLGLSNACELKPSRDDYEKARTNPVNSNCCQSPMDYYPVVKPALKNYLPDECVPCSYNPTATEVMNKTINFLSTYGATPEQYGVKNPTKKE